MRTCDDLKTDEMVKLLVVILTVLILFAAAQGKKWKSCERRIKRFERCLERGYKSKAGCVSGEGKLEGSQAWRRCRKLENKIAKKCDYVCEKSPALISDECRLKNVILSGWELRSLSSSTYEDCEAECSADSECVAFNFASDNLSCELFSSVAEMDRSGSTSSRMMKCDTSEMDMSCMEHNTLFWNPQHAYWNAYKVGTLDTENIEECAKICRDYKICVSLSYNVGKGECTLYDDIPRDGKWDLVRKHSEPYISMEMNC